MDRKKNERERRILLVRLFTSAGKNEERGKDRRKEKDRRIDLC